MNSILLEEQQKDTGILHKSSKHINVFENRIASLIIGRSNPYIHSTIILKLAASSILCLNSLFEVKESEYPLKEYLNRQKSLPGNKLSGKKIKYQILLLPAYLARTSKYSNPAIATSNFQNKKGQKGWVFTKSY